MNNQYFIRIRCFWCGSSDTHFSHFDCWEEDRFGNHIEVGSREEADRLNLSLRNEVWWCNNCDGAFGFPADEFEESDEE
jgi:hypothetical protein